MMEPFLRSLPLFSASLMVLQVAAGLLSIPIAIIAALLFDPANYATFAAAGFGTSASLSLLFWQYASVHARAEQKGRVETGGYLCTMAAVLFLGTLVLGAGLTMIEIVDQNASMIAYWLCKGLWYIAVLYIETACLLFCWSVDMFFKKAEQ